jgi:hypothetical protein
LAAVELVPEEAAATGEPPRGASTITQQLVKNLFFTTHRNPEQGARLAACLPSPRRRRPARMDHYSAIIQARMTQLGCGAPLRPCLRPATSKRSFSVQSLAALLYHQKIHPA